MAYLRYWLGDRAANFIEEFCGAEALGKIVKFMKATREVGLVWSVCMGSNKQLRICAL